MTDMVTMNYVLEAAIAHGASATYETFRDAATADPVLQSTVVRVKQGPKRTVAFVPREIGEAFAARYAKAHPKRAPITKQEPEQMALPLEESNELRAAVDAVAQDIRSLRADVALLLGMFTGANHKLDKLAEMWDAIEDDGK